MITQVSGLRWTDCLVSLYVRLHSNRFIIVRIYKRRCTKKSELKGSVTEFRPRCNR